MTAGQLVPLLPHWKGPEAVFHIAFTSRRAMLPAVRLLVDFLFERLKQLTRGERTSHVQASNGPSPPEDPPHGHGTSRSMSRPTRAPP